MGCPTLGFSCSLAGGRAIGWNLLLETTLGWFLGRNAHAPENPASGFFWEGLLSSFEATQVSERLEVSNVQSKGIESFCKIKDVLKCGSSLLICPLLPMSDLVSNCLGLAKLFEQGIVYGFAIHNLEQLPEATA